MADTKVDKWLEGTTYGPVMKQTDLYLLGAALTINPILSGDHPDVKISFNVASGEIAATNPKTDEELEWAPFQEQPAVLPRCTTLYILCKQTPWCIHVENRTGVTVKDVFSSLFAFHSTEYITEEEWNALSPKVQDKIRRLAKQDPGLGGAVGQGQGQWNYYHTASQGAVRYTRKAWLQQRVNLEELVVDDDYCEQRLGFRGPNVVVMNLIDD